MIDRPRPMLKHCLVKKSLADNLEKIGITVEGSEKFSLRYYKDNTERNYVIDFGDKNKMPSCTCIDWKRSCYPCKHFFIVFKKYPCWNWESISPLYRISPHLNLDFGFEVDKAKTKLTNGIQVYLLIQVKSPTMNMKHLLLTKMKCLRWQILQR